MIQNDYPLPPGWLLNIYVLLAVALAIAPISIAAAYAVRFVVRKCRAKPATLEKESVSDFLTLYCVTNNRDTALALVVANDGADAIQVCIEDGLQWAQGNCQVRRVHKRVSDIRGVVDVMETAGGSGNSKNAVRQFRGGVQIEKPQRQL